MPAQVRQPRDIGDSTIYLRYIPRNLRDQFKAYCTRRGSDMVTEFIGFMRDKVAVDDKLEV